MVLEHMYEPKKKDVHNYQLIKNIYSIHHGEKPVSDYYINLSKVGRSRLLHR